MRDMQRSSIRTIALCRGRTVTKKCKLRVIIMESNVIVNLAFFIVSTMLSFVVIVFLVLYVMVLYNRVRKLEARILRLERAREPNVITPTHTGWYDRERR